MNRLVKILLTAAVPLAVLAGALIANFRPASGFPNPGRVWIFCDGPQAVNIQVQGVSPAQSVDVDATWSYHGHSQHGTLGSWDGLVPVNGTVIINNVSTAGVLNGDSYIEVEAHANPPFTMLIYSAELQKSSCTPRPQVDSVTASCGVTGDDVFAVVTGSNLPATFDIFVTDHKSSQSSFVEIPGSRLTVTGYVSGDTIGPLDISQHRSGINTMRVELSFSNEKSDSFPPCVPVTLTPTATNTPTATATNTPTATKTLTPTSTNTPVPPTETFTATVTPVPPTDTATPTETFTPTPTDTLEPTATNTPEPTATEIPPTDTPEPTATEVPPTDTPEPTATEVMPTATPGVSPTATATVRHRRHTATPTEVEVVSTSTPTAIVIQPPPPSGQLPQPSLQVTPTLPVNALPSSGEGSGRNGQLRFGLGVVLGLAGGLLILAAINVRRSK